MTWLDALVAILLGIFTMMGILLPARWKQHRPSVTNADMEEAKDPDGVALGLAYEIQKDLQATKAELRDTKDALGVVSSDLDATQTDLACTQGELTEYRAENRVLAEENRTFREVLLGVIQRLREIPPPDHASILAFILERIPGLGKDQSS